MGKLINLVGKKFGEWEVLEKAQKPISATSTAAFWKCRCSCGTERILDGGVLRQGKSKSCGCLSKQIQQQKLSEDLTRKRFGSLVVIERAEKPQGLKSNGAYWLCQCDCGNKKVIMGKSLRNGKTVSCGCHIQQYADLLGKRFGKLTVVSREPKSKKWKCQCDCGGIVYVTGSNLRFGHVQSCGCLSSIGEMKIEQILQENNISYIKQFSFSELRGVNGGLLRFDFAIFNKENKLSCLVEFQGEQHYPSKQSKFFDDNVLITDVVKKEYCKEHGILLYCIPYWKRDNLTIENLFSEKYKY